MENFIVSARKYRPITFDLVIGQESITSTLKNAIKTNHLAQAFLFTGPRGVGKTTCARIFAKTINCENLNDKMEACDKCESCTSFNKNNSFNIHELDAASNNSVEDIRRLVEQVRITPQVGQYKVYIIDEVHMLSQAAFNAFLKTLEEPPTYAKFILATTEKYKIIPTILSRCQIYDFNRITVKDIANYLAFVAKNENIEVEEEALLMMAQKADGAMRDALSIFDQIVSFAGNKITYDDTIENLNILNVEYYFKMVEFFLKSDISSSLMVFDEIMNKGFDGLHFINGLASHFRNLLVSKDEQTIKLLETSENIKAKYASQSSLCGLRFLVFGLDLCTAVDLSYKSATDKRLLIELNLMKLCKLNNPFEEPTNTPSIEKKKSEIEIVKQNPISVEIKNTTEDEKATPNKINTEIKPSLEKQTIENKISSPEKQKHIGISIKQAFEKTTIPEKINLDDALNTSFENVGKEINVNDLQLAIEKYIEEIKTEKPAFASEIAFKNIDLLPNNQVVINLFNEALNDNELKYNLLLFLKTELKNNEIQLKINIQEITPIQKNTALDLYNSMNKINPHLNSLREALDLDFAF